MNKRWTSLGCRRGMRAALFGGLFIFLSGCGSTSPTPPEPHSNLEGGFRPLETESAKADESTLTLQGSSSCLRFITDDGKALASCTVRSGQVRVRADCVAFPDLYSPWVGRGRWIIWTGYCPWGVRNAIIESR